MNKIITVVCAVMASLSLTAQTVNSPLSAKEQKAQQAKELKAFKEKQKAELADFIAKQKNPELAKFKYVKPQLNDAADTLAYIFGAFQSNGLKRHLQDQMKVDTTSTEQMEAFYRGILSKVDVDHEDRIVHAQQVGYQIGQQIETLTGNISKDYYAADPGKTISSAVIGKAIIGALMGENEYAPADARALFEAQMEARQAENLERLYGANRKAGEEFLAANAKKEGVVVLPSGLQYKVLTQGNGPIPKLTNTVKVNYEGHLIDGTSFDSSYKRSEPTSFGVRQVIKGWSEALCLMPVGSKWELYIPQELAYGDHDQGQIKPFSALIFTVELLSIEK